MIVVGTDLKQVLKKDGIPYYNCEGCELEKDFEKCSLLNNNKCKLGYIYVKTT